MIGRVTVAVILLLITTNLTDAVEFNLRGQASGWFTDARNNDSWQNRSGIRYIPELSIGGSLSREALVDAEVSFNGFVTTSDDVIDHSDVKLYRLKLRYASTQTELRLGLQKINFGPARLLRPLMWFDRIDPRDPQVLTNGVWGLRFTHYFQNNTNVWLWGLYGEDKTKGLENLPTAEGEVELGGRIQLPVPRGEIGGSFHTRTVHEEANSMADFRENRLALDGRWDVGIGLWFEAVAQQQNAEELDHEWMQMLTVGMDYTFGLGNGLYLLIENMTVSLSRDFLSDGDNLNVSAFNLSYPLGVLDFCNYFGFFDWNREKFDHYLGWQRIYDNFIINPSIFWYPDAAESPLGTGVKESGYGFKFMVVYNH